MSTIDELQIKIDAQAAKAEDVVDRFVTKLERLSTSLNKINGNSLIGLANGVQRLSSAMQSMNSVKTADYTRLANNLQKLGSVNVSSLNGTASSLSRITGALSNLGAVSSNAQMVGILAGNIAKLGNKGAQNAIVNIPQLTIALNNLMTTLSKAPLVSQNLIQMTNALANMASQGSRVGSASNSIVQGLNRTSNAMNRTAKSTKSLAGMFGKLYANFFWIARGIKGIYTAIEGTADYIEAYNYYNVAFGKIASEWSQDWEKYGYDSADSYTKSFEGRMNSVLGKMSGVQIDTDQGLLVESGAKNLGLNIQEITQYASQLASVTNSIGQTGEVSLAAAKSMTMLAGDISSLFNVEYSSVAKNLQSGLIGQSRALYKYGIDITNATLQTYAYNLGVSKSVSEMTQAEKMQLRMIAILDQSKVSWGDLANTINSPSNMIRQLTNNLKEASMVLGQLFIPLLQKVLPVVNGVVIAIKRLLTSVAGILGIELNLDAFGQGFSDDIESGFDDVSDSIDNATSSAKKFKQQLQGFDELNVLTTQDDTGSAGTAGGGSIDLSDEILAATEEYEKVWNEAYEKMENRANEFADKIEKILEPVKKIIQDFAVGDFFQAGQDVSNLIVSIHDFFTRAINEVDWYAIGEDIGGFLAGVEWTEIFGALADNIYAGISAALDLWTGTFDTAPVETTIITALGTFAITKSVPVTLIVTLSLVLYDLAHNKILPGINDWGREFAEEKGLDPKYWDEVVKGTVLDESKNYSVSLLFSIDNLNDNLSDLITETLSAKGIKLPFDIEILNPSKTIGNVQGVFAEWINKNIVSPVQEANTKLKNSMSVLWEEVDKTFSSGLDSIIGFVTDSGTHISAWSLFMAVKTGDFSKIFPQNILDGTNLSEDAMNQFASDAKALFSERKWEGIFSGVPDSLKSMIDIILDMLSGLLSSAQSFVDSFNNLFGAKSAGGKAGKIGANIVLPKIQIGAYATGGFPEDGLFFANHTELVGQFGNGKTAVANNEQITQGFANAVYPAIYNAVYAAMNNFSGSRESRPNIRVYIGDRELTDIAIDGINERTRRTGKTPLELA